MLANRGQVGRFAGVGALATLAHVSVAFLARELMSVGPFMANIWGFACATLISYLGHFYWTFGAAAGHASSLFRFILLSILSLVCTTLIVQVTNGLLHWPFWISLAIILVTVPPANFLAGRFWVFSARGQPGSWTDFDAVLLAGSLLAGFLVYASTALNHDTSWYLVATARWLDGARLYQDIIEINPPLPFFLTAPAIFLSRWTGLPATSAFIVSVFAMMTIALFWSRRIFRRSAELGREEAVILLAAAFVALCVLPVRDFGQRDHLMVVLAMPYFLLSVFRPSLSPAERFAIGVLAVLGLALKPHFVVFPAAIAFLSLVRERRIGAIFNPEHLAILAGFVGYLVFVRLAYPEYFEFIIPAGMEVYGVYGTPLAVVLNPAIFFPLLVLLGLFMLRPVSSDLRWQRSLTLLVIGGAALAVYLLQFKGWTYQRIPVYATLWLLWTWQGLDLLRTMAAPRQWRSLAAVAFASVGLLILQPAFSGPYRSTIDPRHAAFLTGASRPSFLALTAHVYFSFPLANLTNARVTSRFPALWLIPGAVAKLAEPVALAPDERRRVQDILQYARNATTEDFVSGQPEFVFVDVREEKPYFEGSPFSYLDFFLEDERFRKAWKSYRRIDVIDGYEVWQRVPR